MLSLEIRRCCPLATIPALTAAMARCVVHVGCRARQTLPPLELALWRASGVPKVVFYPAGGSRAVSEWAAWRSFDAPGLSPMRPAASWQSGLRDARTSRSPGSAWPGK
jgi:hypothetical protein